MSLELRAIHASKFALAIDQNAAASAHSGAVNHDRIQAHNSPNVCLARDIGHGFHHRDWTDGEDQVNMGSALDHLEQLVSDKPFFGIASVVGGNHELVADFGDLTLQDNQLLVPRADDRNHAVPSVLQSYRRGIRHRSAHASAHDHDRPE